MISLNSFSSNRKDSLVKCFDKTPEWSDFYVTLSEMDLFPGPNSHRNPNQVSIKLTGDAVTM